MHNREQLAAVAAELNSRPRKTLGCDVQLEAAQVSRPFSVLWEHRFADGTREVRVNTITSELQFARVGRDLSAVKTVPRMRKVTLLTEKMISVAFADHDLTVVGQFFPESRTFEATVETRWAVYILMGTCIVPGHVGANSSLFCG